MRITAAITTAQASATHAPAASSAAPAAVAAITEPPVAAAPASCNMRCAWNLQSTSASAIAAAAAAAALVAELVQRRERDAALLLRLVSRAGRCHIGAAARAWAHQRRRVGGTDAGGWSHVPG